MRLGVVTTLTAVVLLAGSLCAGELPSFLQPAPTVIGNADVFGRVLRTFPIGELPTGEGQAPLPLLAVFNPGGNVQGDSCLGLNWSLPLIEAAVYEVDEKTIRAQSPGGQGLDLISVPNEPLRFLSKNYEWEGTREDEVFHLKHKDGWTLTYDRGKIKHVGFPGGKGFTIKRHQPNSVSLVWDKDGGEHKLLLDKDGLLSKIEGPGIDLRCEFERQVPIVTSAFGRAIVSGVGASLRKVTDAKRGLTLLDYEMMWDEEKKVHVMKGSDSLSGTAGTSKHTFKWDSLSGMITEDELALYRIGEVSSALKGISYSVQRSVKGGPAESIVYDATQGVLKYADGQGHTTESMFVLTPGATFGKLRKSITMLDGKQVSSMKFDYDLMGKCLRSTTTQGEEATEWKRDAEGVTVHTPLGKLRFSK